jgi:hypothetical protein
VNVGGDGDFVVMEVKKERKRVKLKKVKLFVRLFGTQREKKKKKKRHTVCSPYSIQRVVI